MALPDSLKLTVGTPIILADTTDHAPATNNNLGTRTDQIDCTSLADDQARQSNQIDFGENRALAYVLSVAIEFAATPTAGETVEFYLAESNSGTAAVANPGGVSGSDSAYDGYSTNLDASLKQLGIPVVMTVTAQATGTVQVHMNVGVFTPTHRYATLVVVNRSGAAFHTDMIETSFVLTPIEHQIQD